MGRRKKNVEAEVEAEVEQVEEIKEPVDEFAQEREDLTLEFTKIVLPSVLAHPESVGWPEFAIAKRARGIAAAVATEFYPMPAKPDVIEAMHLSGG